MNKLKLEIELDEALYSGVLKFLKRRRQKDKELLAKKVELKEITPRLTLISRAICGAAIEIYPAEREGGYKDNNFFLPIEISFFDKKEDNYQFYLFRTTYLSVQRQLQLNWQKEEIEDTQLANQRALETAPIVLAQLFEDYPSLEEIYNQAYDLMPFDKKSKLQDLTWLYGKWMKNTMTPEELEELKNIDKNSKKIENKIDAETTLHAKAVEEIKSLMIDKKQQEDYVLMHSFEKIETAEEFNGNWRDFDGQDELEEHQNALEEMRMRYTVRVDDPVHSVYQADFVENTSVAESAEIDDKGFHLKYDEWNFKTRKYLADYCKVYPLSIQKTNPGYYQKTIQKYKVILTGLRKMLANVNNRMQQQRKQIYGESFDLDALTDLYTDIHSGRTPDERVYLSPRKKEKDISILLLLDLSLSSDSYAAGNRILDVEKEVSILFGEILDEMNIEFSIDGFYSKTRNYTTYITLKDFQENWSKAKNKIGAVEPSGYTRIGPALRHAGQRIHQSDAKNKWIILLSDGKPNDYDKYEGQHGIQDIKQALRELNQKDINTYALAIESQAKYYLPQMFGHNHYEILNTPEALIHSMTKLYSKIKHP
ncbi:MAG: VWA domain-containing protein [Chitinophagales bacterium]|nr:VWA domain-containing protein [Chitinophagales bacterium]